MVRMDFIHRCCLDKGASDRPRRQSETAGAATLLRQKRLTGIIGVHSTVFAFTGLPWFVKGEGVEERRRKRGKAVETVFDHSFTPPYFTIRK
jgi:hypothetical protein